LRGEEDRRAEARPEQRVKLRQLAGKMKDSGEEHRERGGIFIVLKNISSGSSLEPLLIRFISGCSKLESLLI
jgi:hypothetical protein